MSRMAGLDVGACVTCMLPTWEGKACMCVPDAVPRALQCTGTPCAVVRLLLQLLHSRAHWQLTVMHGRTRHHGWVSATMR